MLVLFQATVSAMMMTLRLVVETSFHCYDFDIGRHFGYYVLSGLENMLDNLVCNTLDSL